MAQAKAQLRPTYTKKEWFEAFLKLANLYKTAYPEEGLTKTSDLLDIFCNKLYQDWKTANAFDQKLKPIITFVDKNPVLLDGRISPEEIEEIKLNFEKKNSTETLEGLIKQYSITQNSDKVYAILQTVPALEESSIFPPGRNIWNKQLQALLHDLQNVSYSLQGAKDFFNTVTAFLTCIRKNQFNLDDLKNGKKYETQIEFGISPAAFEIVRKRLTAENSVLINTGEKYIKNDEIKSIALAIDKYVEGLTNAAPPAATYSHSNPSPAATFGPAPVNSTPSDSSKPTSTSKNPYSYNS